MRLFVSWLRFPYDIIGTIERNYKGYGQFEDTKDIIRRGRDTDRQYNDLRQKREKKNIMVHRTLHRKVMIEQREH